VGLDPRLLEILACPDEKGPLYYFEDGAFLFCPACRRRYEIKDDIPVMLLDEAVVMPEADADAILDQARQQGLLPTFGS
jgi:uncharacterized protein YbaR (Trm112 family)